MGKVDAADKRAAGMRFNEVKNELQTAFDAARQRLASSSSPATSETAFDPTLPGTHLRVGRLHPITQTIEELKDIMGRLGFTPAEGPEIEDERYNFEALNIPREHPARDPLDNFYLATAQKSGAASGSGTLLLRSQTSTVQIRVMEKTAPPVRIISLGRVYRPDTADATHYPMFHSNGGSLDRPQRYDGGPENRSAHVRQQLPGERSGRAVPTFVFSIYRTKCRSGLPLE